MKVLTNDDFSKLFLKHGFDKTEINNNLGYQKMGYSIKFHT